MKIPQTAPSLRMAALTAAALTALLTVTALPLALVTACETGMDNDISGNGSLPLAGPRSVQLTARNGALDVQWTKVASAQGVAPTYEVYWNTEQTPDPSKKQPALSDNSQLVKSAIRGLANHTLYYVWVKALYAGLGASSYGTAVSAAPVPPPQAPSAPLVYPGEGMLEVRWSAAADAFTYEVYYAAAAGAGGAAAGAEPPAGSEKTETAETGMVIHGLANGTPYNLWLRATNTAGVSGYVPASGTPCEAAAIPANPPAGLNAASGDGKLNVTWEQVNGVPFYQIYYGTANNPAEASAWPQAVPAAAPRVRAEINGLDNGTTYYVWVKSLNAKGVSPAYSNGAHGTPAPKPAIDYGNVKFVLGEAAGEFAFAQDLPPSPFFPEGRPSTDRLTRVQETALGNLFTDAAAWYLRNKARERVDFVFLNGSHIDNALLKGTVTVGSLSAIVQPDARQDKLILLTLSGSELKAFMEDAAWVTHTGRGGPHNTGFFGNVSKELRYTIQYPKAPELPVTLTSEQSEPYYHGRIKAGTLKLNGQEIADGATYRIATTDYLAAGEYFTRLFTSGRGQSLPSGGIPFWRAVAEYIYDKETVSPQTDGRVQIEGGVPLPGGWQPGTWTDWPSGWGGEPVH